MDIFSSIGDRLREERERLGISQTEAAALAAAAGVSGATRQSQALYEKGARTPDAALLAVLQANGYDVLYVITGQRSMPVSAPPLSREEEVLLDNFRHCSEKERAAIKATSDALARPGAGCKKAG